MGSSESSETNNNTTTNTTIDKSKVYNYNYTDDSKHIYEDQSTQNYTTNYFFLGESGGSNVPYLKHAFVSALNTIRDFNDQIKKYLESGAVSEADSRYLKVSMLHTWLSVNLQKGCSLDDLKQVFFTAKLQEKLAGLTEDMFVEARARLYNTPELLQKLQDLDQKKLTDSQVSNDQKVDAIEKQVKAFEASAAKVQELEAKLIQIETDSKTLQTSSDAKNQELEAKLTQAETKITELEAKLKESEAKITELTNNITQSGTNSQNALDELKKELSEFKTKVENHIKI